MMRGINRPNVRPTLSGVCVSWCLLCLRATPTTYANG